MSLNNKDEKIYIKPLSVILQGIHIRTHNMTL